MLGLSRLAYSLSTNRQIPSALGRLHPTRSTPYVLIIVAALLAAALVVPEDLDFLVGIYAFGAMLAFTIAHLSVMRAALSPSPSATRPYRDAAVGPRPRRRAAAAGGARRARVGGRLARGDGPARRRPATSGSAGWSSGIALYVVYRRADDKPLLARVTCRPSGAARGAAARARLRLDPRAAVRRPPRRRHRADRRRCSSPASRPTRRRSTRRTIEALWVFVVPMSLPLDARLPEAQIKHARQVLARAKAVGEEYDGRAGRDGDRARAARGLRDRRRGARAAASRRSCSAPRSRRGSAAARGSAGAAGRATTSSATSPSTSSQGAVPRDRDAPPAARRLRPSRARPARPPSAARTIV